jgi:DNA-binding NarL/FixJ family response regulator
MSAPPGRSAPTAAGAAQVGLAEVAYQRNELDTALLHATEGIGLCRQLAYTPLLAAGLAALAWIRQATGDPAGALDAISEAERVSPRTAVTGLLNPVPAQRARLLLAQGDLAGAARWVKNRGLGADDELGYPREPGYLVLARVLLARGEAERALALLDRLHAAAAAQDRVGSLIETGALRALALAASDEETAAVDALAGALTIGCPQRYVRVFADEGPPMAALLGRLIAAQRSGRAAASVPLDCLARLQRAFDAGLSTPGHRPGTAAVQGIVEPLTSRELEVLQMLAAGMSNQRIARDLVVSLDTGKKHVSHLLGKLGAASRTEAVARARQLGLIPQITWLHDGPGAAGRVDRGESHLRDHRRAACPMLARTPRRGRRGGMGERHSAARRRHRPGHLELPKPRVRRRQQHRGSVRSDRGLPAPRSLLGTVRISVTPAPGAGPVFAGIAPAGVASQYLTGVGYDTVRGITHYQPLSTGHAGGAPATAPARAGIWAARAAGSGTQTLTWPDRGGSRTVAAMNADGSRPVAVRISVAASLPSLDWIAAGLLAGGILVLAGGYQPGYPGRLASRSSAWTLRTVPVR